MTIHRCAVRRKRPDGPAPYYGIYASGRWGSLVSMWDQIKTGVSEAIAAHGGTITHHHAVGRDHAPAYDRQRPDPFAAAPRAHCPVWGVLTTALHSHDELVIAFDPPTRRVRRCSGRDLLLWPGRGIERSKEERQRSASRGRRERIVKISYGATVALPPDQTFAFVSDPSNWPLFITGLQSVDKGQDWGAVGGHAQMTNVLLGKSFTSELELTEWDPPKAYRYTVRQTGAPEIDNRRVYEPVSGGTRLRGTSEATPRAGLGGLADRLRMWALRRMMNKSMAQLPDAALQHGITT